jgi:lysophospholipase L1-like esterase
MKQESGSTRKALTLGLGLAVVSVVSVVACTSTPDDSTSSPTAQVDSTATPTTSTVTVPASTAGSTNATGPDSISIVGLGDSIPAAANCSTPCQSYVEVLGDKAATRLGQQVTATNLATNDSLTSTTLLARLKSDPAYTDAIRDADAITVQIGFNDWQSTCYWPDHEDCVKAGEATVRNNLNQILDEINTLRTGSVTAVWVVGYYDNTIGDPSLDDNWTLTPADEPEFHAFYAAALGDFNAMLCDVATAHNAMCVGLVPAFNGPGHDQDPGELVGADHLHPSQSGQDLIATTIDSAGYGSLS